MNSCLQTRGQFNVDGLGLVTFISEIVSKTKIDNRENGNKLFIVQDDCKKFWVLKRIATCEIAHASRETKILQYLNDLNVFCVPTCKNYLVDVNCTFAIFEYFEHYLTWKQFASTVHAKDQASKNLRAAIAEIHKCCVLHCDLHNENILIHPKSFDVKIIDFGLSTFKDVNLDEQDDLQMVDERISELHSSNNL